MSQVSPQFGDSKQGIDRRVHTRQPVRSLAYVELGEGNGGIVLNVSEGGIAVQAVMSLMAEEIPRVRVQLSHSKKTIEAKGRIAWTSGLRKLAGVEFVDLTPEARGLLQEWVNLETPATQLAEEAAAPSEHEESPAKQRQNEAAARNAIPDLIEFPSFPPRVTAKLADLPEKAEPLANATPPARAEKAPIAFSPAIAPGIADEKAPKRRDAASPSDITGSAERVPAKSSIHLDTASERVDETIGRDSEIVPVPGLATRASAAWVPPDRFGFKADRPLTEAGLAAPRERRWKMPALVGIFAVVSLAAGWFAGHGLRGMLGKTADATPENVSAENAPAQPAANASNIEVVDVNNQRWLVPMQGPLTALRPAAARLGDSNAVPDPQTNMNLGVELSAPVTSQIREATASDKANPPAVVSNSSGPENILPATAGGNSRSEVAIPPPPAVFPSASASSLPPASKGAATAGGLNNTPASAAGTAPPSASAGAHELRQSALQSGQLVHRVEPVYPSAALAQGLEGTVTLYAVIDADGTVRTIEPISGPDLLIPAAVSAVRQWRYSQSTLNGRAIQTERQITINFRLSKSQ